MNYTICRLSPVCLAGTGFFGNPFSSHAAWTEENEIGLLWKRYFSLMTEAGYSYQGQNTGLGAARPSMPMEMYELHILHPQSLKTGDYEVFIGHRIQPEDLPDWNIRFSTKVLPGGEYAVFSLAGEAMTGDWTGDLILPQGYRLDMGFSVNLYDERFKGMDRLNESEIQVYAPLLRD